MPYREKYITKLVNSLMLLKTQLLPDFPSGSSINYRDDKLYLIGDDANTILILDKEYNTLSSVQLFNYSGKRIPKPLKADLEASVFVTLDGQDHLVILGSASATQRQKVILIPFSINSLNMVQALTINTETFINRLNGLGIHEVNIEGATVIGQMLIIGNRGNRKNTTNQLIITSIDFWKNQSEARIEIISMSLSSQAGEALGISEVCYVKETDVLLIAYSSEQTDNAYDDGVIGDSYLGWIRGFSQKTNMTSLSNDGITNLSDVHEAFKREKIEGLCAESINKDEMVIHLISDNDQGASRLFKIGINLE